MVIPASSHSGEGKVTGASGLTLSLGSCKLHGISPISTKVNNTYIIVLDKDPPLLRLNSIIILCVSFALFPNTEIFVYRCNSLSVYRLAQHHDHCVILLLILNKLANNDQHF